MTRADIACYRKNYDSKVWARCARHGWVTLPEGILRAINDLCDEVERFQMSQEERRSP